MSNNTDPVQALIEFVDQAIGALEAPLVMKRDQRKRIQEGLEQVRAALATQPSAPVLDEAAATRAFEEHIDGSADDPYFEGELELWLAACRWHSRLPAGVDGDEVRRVAQHIEGVADYIDMAYPDAKTLVASPILRNMRRWHERLTAALAQQQAPIPSKESTE